MIKERKWQNDKLTAGNAALVEALDEAVRSFKSEYDNCPPRWEEALKKAKGEV